MIPLDSKDPAQSGLANALPPRQDIWIWSIPAMVTVLLVITSQFNVLLFHTLAELFAVIVAVLVGIVAWQMYGLTHNNYLLYLGYGYFWVGSVDLLHTLTFKDMEIFSLTGSNITLQYWIGARLLESVLLLSAPLFLQRRLYSSLAFLGYGFIVSALITSIYYGWFPVCYIEGEGLSNFKIYSEYFSMLLLIAALAYLWKHQAQLEQKVFRYIAASIALTVAAELSFTLYVGLFDIPIIVGHIFKFFSFWLIFMATVRLTLQQPLLAMSRSASTYDAIPDITILVDQDNIIRQANRAAAEFSGLATDQLIGQHCHDIFHPKTVDIERCKICQGGKELTSLSSMEMKQDGKNQWFSYSLSPTSGNVGMQGTVQVIRDISKQKQAELQIQLNKDNLEHTVTQQTEELESINRELESFCYSISHDLRAPLRAINGFGQAVMEDYRNSLDATAIDFLDRICDRSTKMGDMLDDILQLSKTAREEIKISNINLSQLSRELLDNHQAADPTRNMEISIQADIYVQADKTLLRILMQNLLDNAWKFTAGKDPATIEVGTKVIENQVVFFIKDNGAGFDMKYSKKLFGAFQRLHSKDEFEGNGIGLATAARIVHRHGGHIWADAVKNQGATFFFTLSSSN